jgi:hypothetical protein
LALAENSQADLTLPTYQRERAQQRRKVLAWNQAASAEDHRPLGPAEPFVVERLLHPAE